MTILLKSGTAKSLGVTAHWEVTQESSDVPSNLTVLVYRKHPEIDGLELAARLFVEEYGHGEGQVTFTDLIRDDDCLFEPIHQAGMLVYLEEETWAHIALDIFNNS